MTRRSVAGAAGKKASTPPKRPSRPPSPSELRAMLQAITDSDADLEGLDDARPPKPPEIHHRRTEPEVGEIYRLLGLTPTGSPLTITLVLPGFPLPAKGTG